MASTTVVTPPATVAACTSASTKRLRSSSSTAQGEKLLELVDHDHDTCAPRQGCGRLASGHVERAGRRRSFRREASWRPHPPVSRPGRRAPPPGAGPGSSTPLTRPSCCPVGRRPGEPRRRRHAPATISRYRKRRQPRPDATSRCGQRASPQRARGRRTVRCLRARTRLDPCRGARPGLVLVRLALVDLAKDLHRRNQPVQSGGRRALRHRRTRTSSWGPKAPARGRMR